VSTVSLQQQTFQPQLIQLRKKKKLGFWDNPYLGRPLLEKVKSLQTPQQIVYVTNQGHAVATGGVVPQQQLVLQPQQASNGLATIPQQVQYITNQQVPQLQPQQHTIQQVLQPQQVLPQQQVVVGSVTHSGTPSGSSVAYPQAQQQLQTQQLQALPQHQQIQAVASGNVQFIQQPQPQLQQASAPITGGPQFVAQNAQPNVVHVVGQSGTAPPTTQHPVANTIMTAVNHLATAINGGGGSSDNGTNNDGGGTVDSFAGLGDTLSGLGDTFSSIQFDDGNSSN
jgi:hypothetical protein